MTHIWAIGSGVVFLDLCSAFAEQRPYPPEPASLDDFYHLTLGVCLVEVKRKENFRGSVDFCFG